MEVPEPENFAFELLFVLISSCAFAFVGGYFIYENHTIPSDVFLASLILSEMLETMCVASRFCLSKDIRTPVLGSAKGGRYLERFEKLVYVLNVFALSSAVSVNNPKYYQLTALFPLMSAGLSYFSWRITIFSNVAIMFGISCCGFYLEEYYAASGAICCAISAFVKGLERRGGIIRTKKVSRIKKYIVQSRWSLQDTFVILFAIGNSLAVVQVFMVT